MEDKKITYHRHLVEQIALALFEIFSEHKYADKIIEKNLKTHKKWGSRDRRFFAESVYECVRWWRKLWAQLDVDEKLTKENLIRIWGIYLLNQKMDLPDWPELRDLKLKSIPPTRAIIESIPDWLDQLGKAEMGDRWDAILHSLNQKSYVDIRINTLKISAEKAYNELVEQGLDLEKIPDTLSGYTLKERKNVFTLPAFQSGYFEVQDRASQKVAPLLNPQPGERVIDACAGAGGKTLHLAALMKNKGKIISLDIHAWKLAELEKRARRNGISIVETRVIESTKVVKRLQESADAVLLDVPCSGLGVLRRNPDSKWKLSLEEIQRLQNLQREILESYSRMVKPEGRLLYSTCSFLRSENEAQVEWFLQKHPDWKLVEKLRIDPDYGQGDGFFAALMTRSTQ